ncbi:cytochrome c3 family protein [Halodesulfovibrio sp.]|jgi:hypothetical protein|uniref:cytochrome c3 family protein n=1 Tax=Halodesulfovibrio sp. TaxID=1912772 RepID=UPI0025D2AA0C|nr:cytochrome c3 family protein [Halodesulfovibrio sp.]MCT4534674.1 cytochrome c3 family protein [Halodesulfovibrio sp.]MCT4625513.1 cytochrome c3 family protein [Halodesulfovibrio sp.]
MSKKVIVLLALVLVAVCCIVANANSNKEAEKPTKAEVVLKKNRVRQNAITWMDSNLFGKLPVKKFHEKIHQNGANCEYCHGVVSPVEPADIKNCFQCHGTPEDIAKRTEKLEPNPHNSPHWGTELPCDSCHKEHGKSEFYCKNCHHFDYQVP